MPTGDRQAIANATRLSEIEFPEFTAKLITGTFDAITASYIAQMTQYMSILQVTAQTLTDYINNTADDISADEIGAFLVALGTLDDAMLSFLLGDATSGGALVQKQVDSITRAVVVPAVAGPALSLTTGNLNTAKKDAIVGAIARRIKVNKYDLLQTMVRQGLPRFIVDNGTIETRLTFTTYGQSVSSSSTSNLDRANNNLAAAAGLGVAGLLGAGAVGVGGAGGVTATRLTVSTAKESQRDVSGSRVQVFGRVKLNFKTDFLPLNVPQP